LWPVTEAADTHAWAGLTAESGTTFNELKGSAGATTRARRPNLPQGCLHCGSLPEELAPIDVGQRCRKQDRSEAIREALALLRRVKGSTIAGAPSNASCPRTRFKQATWAILDDDLDAIHLPAILRLGFFRHPRRIA